MRRKDREVTDAGKIREAIEASHCCRLGFYDEGEVYIVPMNFGYTDEGEKACQYSAGFLSVIGTGNIDFVEDRESKKSALQTIMLHNTGKSNWEFSEDMLDAVLIFKMEVTQISCKEHL